MRAKTFITWLVNFIGAFALGALFWLPWIYSADEIRLNTLNFWTAIF